MLEHFSWRIEKGILHHNNNTDQVTKEGKEINKKRERERERKGRKEEREKKRNGEGPEKERRERKREQVAEGEKKWLS